METHWKQDIISFHSHVTGMYVSKSVCPSMPNMLRRIWIWIRYCYEIFLLCNIRICLEDPLLFPFVPPFFFYCILFYSVLLSLLLIVLITFIVGVVHGSINS